MSLTATMMAERGESYTRNRAAHAQALESFLKRLRAICQIADEASGLEGRAAYLDRDMERELHYLIGLSFDIGAQPAMSALQQAAEAGFLLAKPSFIAPNGDKP